MCWMLNNTQQVILCGEGVGADSFNPIKIIHDHFSCIWNYLKKHWKVEQLKWFIMIKKQVIKRWAYVKAFILLYSWNLTCYYWKILLKLINIIVCSVLDQTKNVLLNKKNSWKQFFTDYSHPVACSLCYICCLTLVFAVY